MLVRVVLLGDDREVGLGLGIVGSGEGGLTSDQRAIADGANEKEGVQRLDRVRVPSALRALCATNIPPRSSTFSSSKYPSSTSRSYSLRRNGRRRSDPKIAGSIIPQNSTPNEWPSPGKVLEGYRCLVDPPDIGDASGGCDVCRDPVGGGGKEGGGAQLRADGDRDETLDASPMRGEGVPTSPSARPNRSCAEVVARRATPSATPTMKCASALFVGDPLRRHGAVGGVVGRVSWVPARTAIVPQVRASRVHSCWSSVSAALATGACPSRGRVFPDVCPSGLPPRPVRVRATLEGPTGRRADIVTVCRCARDSGVTPTVLSFARGGLDGRSGARRPGRGVDVAAVGGVLRRPAGG